MTGNAGSEEAHWYQLPGATLVVVTRPNFYDCGGEFGDPIADWPSHLERVHAELLEDDPESNEALSAMRTAEETAAREDRFDQLTAEIEDAVNRRARNRR